MNEEEVKGQLSELYSFIRESIRKRKQKLVATIDVLNTEKATEDDVKFVLNMCISKQFDIAGDERDKMMSGLKRYKSIVAEIFECEEDEIWIGDVKNNPIYCHTMIGDWELDNIKDGYKMCKDACFNNLIGDIKINNCFLDTLGFIKNVCGNIEIKDSIINEVGSLENVKDFIVTNSKIYDFESIKRVRPYVIIMQDEQGEIGPQIGLYKLPDLSINGDFRVSDSEITDFHGIDYVKGNAIIKNSKIGDMNYLSVEDKTCITSSEIENLKVGMGNFLRVKNCKINEYDSIFNATKSIIDWEDNNVTLKETKEDFVKRVKDYAESKKGRSQ